MRSTPLASFSQASGLASLISLSLLAVACGSSSKKSESNNPAPSAQGESLNGKDQNKLPPGKPDQTPGKPDQTPGKPDQTPGKPDQTPGKPDQKPGQPDQKPGNPDQTPGQKPTTPVVVPNPNGQLPPDQGPVPVPPSIGQLPPGQYPSPTQQIPAHGTCFTTGTQGSLGFLTDFNLVVFGNSQLNNTTIEGRAAIGANASFNDASIGAILPAQPLRPDLIVNGNLNFSSGSVPQGQVVVGGTSQVHNVNVRGSVIPGWGLDFATLQSYVMNASRAWASTPTSGWTQVEGSNVGAFAIRFQSHNAGVNSFYVTAADLSRAKTVSIDTVPGSGVVINVSGSEAWLQYTNFVLNGVSASNIVFNFYEAQRLHVYGTNVAGSILAPYAQTDISNIEVQGSLVTNSLLGMGQIRYVPYTACSR